jgi:hypothetical protein
MDHSEYREEILHGDHPVSYDHSEPHARSIAIYMSATVVLLIFVGIAIQAYYDLIHSKGEYEQVLSQENWQLRDLRNKEQWELTHYGYVDKNTGAVRIPIDEAMKMVAQDAAANQLKYPTKSYRVKTAAELAAAGSPGVSPAGAAAADAAQKDGATSSPNVQPPSPEQQK